MFSCDGNNSLIYISDKVKHIEAKFGVSITIKPKPKQSSKVKYCMISFSLLFIVRFSFSLHTRTQIGPKYTLPVFIFEIYLAFLLNRHFKYFFIFSLVYYNKK